MRTLSTLLVSVSLGVAGATLPPATLHAQNVRAVGGFAGRTDSWQSWTGHEDAQHRHGVAVGAFISVDAPPSWLSVTAEAAYVQRGARLPLGSGGGGAELLGDVRAAYLAASVLPTARFEVGPLSLYGYAGPGMEVHLGTRTAGELAIAYQEDKAQVLIGAAGVGLELLLQGRWSVRGEVRRTIDLTPAYATATGDIRFRSTEILLRVGIRPAR